MPTSKRPCRYRGCPAIVEGNLGGGYCPEHRRQVRKERDARRSGPRPYSSAHWQRLRRLVLGREPLCRICMADGRVVEATVVDHITPLADGGTNDVTNLQPLCKPCHDRKTMRESVAPKASGRRG